MKVNSLMIGSNTSGGDFKDVFVFTPSPAKMIHFDEYVLQNGLVQPEKHRADPDVPQWFGRSGTRHTFNGVPRKSSLVNRSPSRNVLPHN